MKNNEILISVRFLKADPEGDELSRTMSFLVLKDITLKALVQGLYYGLRELAKRPDFSNETHQLSANLVFFRNQT